MMSVFAVVHNIFDIIFNIKQFHMSSQLSQINLLRLMVFLFCFQTMHFRIWLFLTCLFHTACGRKDIRVQLAPKKGSNSISVNYRSVLFLSVVRYVMEWNINSNILKHPEPNKLIHEKHCGFRHERSAADLFTFLYILL